MDVRRVGLRIDPRALKALVRVGPLPDGGNEVDHLLRCGDDVLL